MSVEAWSTTYRVKLIDRYEVAENTMAFRFEKPAHFTFTPGQFIDMTLVDSPETDAKGNKRTFSIASSPEDDILMVATRLRNTAFKRVLRTMSLGTQVSIEGPFGDLILHTDATRPAVFLAGGIGITPFRSILLHAAKAELSHHLVLIYSNRRPEDAAFFDELEALQRDNPRYTFVGTMTQAEHSYRSWQGERGKVSRHMLDKLLKDLVGPIYYVAGPPRMVGSLQSMLTEAGVKNEDIRAEEFFGY
ncbi:MAG: FAD-dependent oxidoreductase [Nitrospira sp.]|nr:FAD-dependent oxidoreductase [Nitrospira sp.]